MFIIVLLVWEPTILGKDHYERTNKKTEICTLYLYYLSLFFWFAVSWINVEQRNWVFVTNYNFKIRISLQPYVLNLRYFKLRFFPYLVPLFELFLTKNKCLFRVSTKWLNLSRKFFFCEILRYFCAWNAMSFPLFFCAICAKPEIFFAKVAHETKF